ncbi:MAG: UDP-N-acetylglucosamine 2-epimerase [Desulfomonilaceae bacterium]|jgi:UDP-N-acetylglucosamine 2-epimerase (non-hydrolysing)/GDP/UDP-N,N'-diacetylbacillosamine 2-epimerase (hydrolysing)
MNDSYRKICVVTGSRAEYGLLQPVISALNSDERFEMQLIVTGMHLSPEFGYTVSAIEDDGYEIAERVESLISGDTPAAITKSIGLGVIGFADVFRRLTPDWLLILGDRFEVFAAAQAALVANIPIAHIAGGDTTEGAFDEAIRHCITKMAHLHLVTNELSARRVRQLGEDPKAIHVVGSPGIDAIHEMKLIDREALEKDLGITFKKRNLLITHHPVTLDPSGSAQELEALLSALDNFGDETGLFFTKANADTSGRTINRVVEDWVSTRSNAELFTSLGSLRYLSLMNEVDVVVGNSSSGLYEAPSFHTPTVNIGDRQRGRLSAGSVIHCEAEPMSIHASINKAFELDVSQVENPYGDGHSTQRIIEAIAAVNDPKKLLKKRFHMTSSS